MKTSRLLLLLALGLFFVAVGWWCGPRAFPLANIDFSVTRMQAEGMMKQTIESLGHPLEGYKSTSTFGNDDEAKEFVELQYGVPTLEERNKAGMSIWYWVGRWFKPGQHEEFYGWVDVQGHLVGYRETIKEEEPVPSLNRDQAFAVAEAFLLKYVPRHPASERKLVSESIEERPHRQDRTFTWEQDNLRLGEAPYRLTIIVFGNRVGEYGEALKVPEEWQRQYERSREVNELCATLAGYGLALLGFGVAITFIRGIMRHTIRWRDAMPWGWIIVFGGVTLAATINSIPSSLFGYKTTQEWPAFVTEQTLSAILEALAAPLSMWLLFLIADAVQRERLPAHSALKHVLGRHALRDPQVVRALGIGILAALGGYAYVSSFYVVGARFGVWAPVDVDHSQVLSGYLPWIEPMKIGLEAAFGEEFLFRLIAILLFWWVFRIRWIAVVLAAVIWAFLHSTYPQMPGYIRGLELTVEGIIWGVLFLRFGIVSTLTAHYLYNCWLGSMVIVQSASWFDRIGALTVASWPVLLFLWAVWRRRHHVVPVAEPLPTPPPLPVEDIRFTDFAPHRLTSRQLLACLAFGVLLLAMMNLVPLAQQRIQALGRHDLSKDQILARADAVLREKGIDPTRYLRTVRSNTGGLPSVRYMLEHGRLADLTTFYGDRWPDLNWYVRYFRILEKEEYSVRLDQHGKLIRWSHDILDETPGADLDEAAATALACTTLARDAGLNPEQDKLITISPTKEENRRDYYFVFERKDIGWGDATLRTSLKLQGDEAVGASRWVQVPEAWTREQSKSGWLEAFRGEFRVWTAVALSLVGAVFLVFLIRRRVMPWRLAFLLGLFPPALAFLDALNDLPGFYVGYTTTTPLANFVIYKIGRIIMPLLGVYLGSVFLVAVALGTARWGLGLQFRDLLEWPRDRTARRDFLFRTLVIAIFGAICFRFENYAKNLYVGYAMPSWATDFGSYSVTDALPWLSAITGPLKGAFSSTLGIVFAAGLFVLTARRWPRASWAALFLLPLFGALGEDVFSDFGYRLVTGEFRLLLIVGLVIFLWRFNLAAIFLSYAFASFASWLSLIWTKGGPPYQWQVAPVLLFLALSLGLLLFAHWRTPTLNGSDRPS